MEENTQPTPAQQTPDTAIESREPQLLLAAAPVRQMLVGGTFLAISIVSGVALISAYLPSIGSYTETQIAAVEAVPDSSAYDALTLQAKSVYVFDASNDSVLFSKNPDTQLPLASITKVVLALVVSEVLPMEGTVTISPEAVAKGGGGLTAGEVWRVRDLIDYMLIASSNTAAEALAEAAREGIRIRYPEAAEKSVVWRMNRLTKDLGMQSTYFLNASGLDESVTQAGALGSAEDVAKLFVYAMRTNRELFAGTSREFATLGPLNGVKRDVHNTNMALTSVPHIYMGKTGLTDLAGGNLAIAYDAGDGHPVIVVVLGSSQEGRFSDVTSLVGATASRTPPQTSTN